MLNTEPQRGIATHLYNPLSVMVNDRCLLSQNLFGFLNFFQEQYIFLHDGVLEMVHCGFTEIVAENLKTEIERLEQKELNKSLTGFEIEFKVRFFISSFFNSPHLSLHKPCFAI